MRRYLFLLILLVPLVSANAQAPTTIEQCYLCARENYPLAKRYGLIEQAKEFNVKNAGKAYLPQIGVSAKASYQTESTQSPIPQVPLNMPLDQYLVAVEVNQAIWDGGTAKAQKRGIEAGAAVETRQLDVDLYALNDRINNLYFGILTLDEQLALNDLLDAELKRNEATVSSYINGGIANAADLDAVRVELLDNRQKRAAIVASREAYVSMLSSLVGFRVDQIEKPVRPLFVGDTLPVRRPELTLMDAQRTAADTKRLEITAAKTPRIGAFVQGAYGQPGLDMFKTGLTPYAIGGLKLSWNVSGFYTSKNNKAKIEVEKNSIEAARETFLFNTNLELEQSTAEIKRIKAQMVDDDQIIELRGNIKRSAEAKVAQGTLTVTEMLREVTAENAAMRTRALHEVELLMTLYDIKYKTNN